MTPEEFTARYMPQFSEQQKAAVRETEGPVLLLAVPGSGKTTVLVTRLGYMALCRGIDPAHILAVTYTVAATRELRARFTARFPELAGQTPEFRTINGLSSKIIEACGRQRGPAFALQENAGELAALVGRIYQALNGDYPTDSTIREVRTAITYCKNMMLSADEIAAQDFGLPRFSELYAHYCAALREARQMDYDDQMAYALAILRKQPEILAEFQARYPYLCVDESQDTSRVQHAIIELLAKKTGNLFMVGDEDQSIYGFRAAYPEALLRFSSVWPGAKTLLLEDNYRSTPEILAACNSLISKNANRIKKDLLPMLPGGAPVLCHHAANSEQEARWIAAQIKTLHEAGTPYRDMAILYRAHYITRGVEEILLKEKIPYTIYSGVQFFARAEIKDALSYLRMIACRDDLSFLRIANVPKRNLGERRMAFLKDYAAQNGCSLYDALRRNLDSELLRGTKGGKFVSLIESFTGIYDQMPVSELLAAVLNESGYEAMLRTEGSQMRLDNLAELKQSVYAYETTCGEECTLEHYLAHVALFTNADLDDPRDQVRLMTVHSAKGLEFPHVFLCAMNEGIFPSKKTRTLPGMEEERRLCFVAMTRAQKALYLSEAEGRNLDGSPRYPSRFLLDIDDSLLQFTHTPREDLIRQAREYIGFSTRLLDESSLPQGFAPGTRVRHAVFGPGTVLELDPAQRAQLVQFDSMPTPRLLSLRTKLERI